MSSNRTIDPNDLYRLLSQYQQHASSSAQRFQTVSGVLPAPAAVASTPPAVMQLLASLVADHQQQSLGGVPDTNSTGTSGNSAHGLSAFQAQMRPPYQLGIPRPSSTANVNGGDMGQQILASAQLLSALNPDLAATAIANAFNLNPQQPVHQQPPQQLQQQRQPNSILESLCQQLQHHTSIPSSSPTAAELNLCFQSESATMAPASSAKILDVNQKHATPSDISTPDTRNTIKNTTALPISLHCLDQNIPPQVAAASCSSACPPSNLSAKNWTLEQLESYAKQLQDSHQPIPQSIAILLASARRREEKHNAKKLANRKSAFSSRIRKKAKIDAMAEENVRLKREANILSFLPDPVLAIGISGEITFCSTQMERVSLHKASDLIGENVEKVIAPATWGELRRMVKDVATAKEEAVHLKQKDIARVTNATKQDGLNKEGNSWGYSTRGNPSGVSMQSSEHSFPINEVAVDSNEKVSDPSGYYLKKTTSQTATQAFSVNDNYRKTHTDEDEDIVKTSNKKSHQDHGLQSCLNHERVLETIRSLSSLTEREGYKSSLSTDSSLSKTKGRPSQSNLSEDSGYMKLHNGQESNKSSSYSCGDTDEDGAIPPEEVNRTPPLAPACIVCLIRNDLSTLWCELTSSIRTVHISNGDYNPAMLGWKNGASKERQKSSDDTSNLKKRTVTSEKPEEEMKELLLCFRPILEGSKVRDDFGLRKKGVSKSP